MASPGLWKTQSQRDTWSLMLKKGMRNSCRTGFSRGETVQNELTKNLPTEFDMPAENHMLQQNKKAMRHASNTCAHVHGQTQTRHFIFTFKRFVAMALRMFVAI